MPMSNAAPFVIDNDAASAGMREVAIQKRRCDEEKGVLRAILKRLKNDGLDTKGILATVALSKLDPEVVRNQLRTQLHYMALRNMPVTQDDLFAGQDLGVTAKTNEQETQWEAEDAGYRAGRNGVRIDEAPYPAGSPLHVRWLEFWHKGQAAIARELGDNAKVVAPSRGRSARKAASENVIEPEAIAAADENESGESDETEIPVKRGRGRPPSANPKFPRRARRAAAQPESAAAE
jgi:hypothetical protein